MSNHDVLDPRDIVPDEAEQLRTSGHRLPVELEELLAAAQEAGDADALRDLLPRLHEEAVLIPRWPYVEPDDLDGILARSPGTGAAPRQAPDQEALRDRIAGAWLGRSAGCCVGKPVEGLTPEQIRRYLRAADAWPLTTYVPLLETLPEGIDKLNPSWTDATLGRVDGMPRDDDTDYTILGLHLLERYGEGFTCADVAREWLDKLPFTQTFTAERIAYRNIVSGVPVEEAARVENPYREWIGALIRADVFGYVSPGDPERAARLAYQDASLSHRGNGIYGEMWAAALVAGALTADTVREALELSLPWLPSGSRLADAVMSVVEIHASGRSWDEAIAWIDESYRDYSWVHTLSNAAVITAGLLWGGDDFAAAVGLTVQAGYDTDSAGATVGSVVGAVLGAQRLPGHLIDPLHDRVRSAVRGYDGSRISELADRTLALATAAR